MGFNFLEFSSGPILRAITQVDVYARRPVRNVLLMFIVVGLVDGSVLLVRSSRSYRVVSYTLIIGLASWLMVAAGGGGGLV